MARTYLFISPALIGILFITVVFYLKGVFQLNIITLTLIISFLFLISNVVLSKFTSKKEKFPLVYLSVTAIQFFVVLSIFLVLVYLKNVDLRFILISNCCLFFIQVLTQAIFMIYRVNEKN